MIRGEEEKIFDRLDIQESKREERESTQGMPRLLEARKDVTSCEKPWGLAHTKRSMDIRMGEPDTMKTYHRLDRGERRELKHLSTCRKRK